MYAIVPICRPDDLHNVLCNFRRQTLQDKKLIIVENGPALGICARRGFIPHKVLTSGESAAEAKNEALDWIRKQGGGKWTTFDSDDYYGPRYLAEASDGLCKADICGKTDIFLRGQSGGLFQLSYGKHESFVDGVHGATISCRAENSEYFPEIPLGEDSEWLQKQRARGMSLYSTSPEGFLNIRNDRSLTAADDDSFFRLMKWVTAGKCTFRYFGSPDLWEGIVNGAVIASSEVYEPAGELRPEDSPAYRLLVAKRPDSLAGGE